MAAMRHTQPMITLHFAGYQPARSVHTRALHALRDSVARRTGGALAIDVTDSVVASGRKAADLLTMVANGELDGCYFASSYLAARVPALGVFDQPFQAGSREEVFAGLDGDTGAALAERVAAATDYRVLAWWDNGIRHISNAVRPIRTPADCVGLRLRTLDNAQHQAAFRRLGFQPIFIDVADLPRAVAERTVDAQENPLTNLVNFNLQMHHKHVSLTGHLLGIASAAGQPRAVRRIAGRTAPRPRRRGRRKPNRSSVRWRSRKTRVSHCWPSRLPLEPGAIDLQGFRAAVAT